MLTARPRIPDAENEQPNSSAVSPNGARAEGGAVDHHSQICPTCGERLDGYRCKLICKQCGYYLSCADYY